VHNTYFTLPVIFAMLSNHYSFLYTHELRWVLLFVMMLAGALIRQFFVQRHGYHLGRAKNPWPFAAVGVVLILGVIVALRPTPQALPTASAQASAAAPFSQVQTILAQRCYMCHGAQVQMKNVRLDFAEGVKMHAQNVYQQVVVSKQMPMNNATGITDAERATIAQWFQGGAKTE
jgi:uncharacterized membrane protein